MKGASRSRTVQTSSTCSDYTRIASLLPVVVLSIHPIFTHSFTTASPAPSLPSHRFKTLPSFVSQRYPVELETQIVPPTSTLFRFTSQAFSSLSLSLATHHPTSLSRPPEESMAFQQTPVEGWISFRSLNSGFSILNSVLPLSPGRASRLSACLGTHLFFSVVLTFFFFCPMIVLWMQSINVS
ncbi:uncharacterized protein B0T23DRAFT_371540 [Neurospora hispaniola]|uniref:Uncharacterized protein n=1 Tax=Neurospora hispaniola TaxID=588809 RepID=A0AAJ0MVU7_9PEZI|nr:hypothetical protein B0T23DRAFT_371540 [Neurospora hispaniola]